MKLKFLSTAALVAALATGTLLPTAVNAAPDELKSQGTVEYEEDVTPTVPVNPEDPDAEIDIPGSPDVTPNPDSGVIRIDAVTNLDFGTQKIGAYSTPQEYKASAASITDTNGVQTDVGHFIQWTDKRAGNDHSYVVNAALTSQFTNGSNKLTGATITYANPLISSAMPVASWPQTAPTALVLDESGAKQPVLDNSAATGAEGLGTYLVEFGTSSSSITNAKGESSTGLADDSVTLTVPAGLNVVKGQYVAEITWAIEYTPAAVTPTP